MELSLTDNGERIKRRMVRISDDLHYMIQGIKIDHDCTYIEAAQKIFSHLMNDKEFKKHYMVGRNYEQNEFEKRTAMKTFIEKLSQSAIINFEKIDDKNTGWD